MRSLRIVPDLRSSVVEEMPADQVLLHTSQRSDADASLVTGNPSVRPFTWSRLVGAARDPDLELVEVAEPLWLGEWVRAVRYLVVVKALRALSPGCARLTAATYAIENFDGHERLAAASSRPRLARTALGLSVLLLDAIAFGTTGAHDNYARTVGRAVRRTRHVVLTPRLDTCSVCGPAAGGTAARERTVLFLGAPGERKGFPELVRAWERCGAVERGWRLLLVDPSGTASASLPPGVVVSSAPPREEVHALLRASAVVAMPSVRRPGWREQIGLPLVEGLAHGCRVVTTTETGLADDLRDHPLVTLTTPGDTDSLVNGLRRVTADGPAPVVAARPGWSKRDVVDWWLAGRPAGRTGREV